MAHEEFKAGGKVRVSEPDSPFYDWAGVVQERVTGPEVDSRPHRYYRVKFELTPSHLLTFETVRKELTLTFREHQLTHSTK